MPVCIFVSCGDRDALIAAAAHDGARNRRSFGGTRALELLVVLGGELFSAPRNVSLLFALLFPQLAAR